MEIKLNSLKARLTLVLLLLVFLPTAIISWVAYNMMFETFRSERIKDVDQVADAKHNQLTMVLSRANTRAEHFLSELSARCGGSSAKLNHLCATDLIRPYLVAEGAIGAILRGRDGDYLTIGASATAKEEPVKFQTRQLAKFYGTGPESDHSYFISVEGRFTELRLEITYPISVLAPVFNLGAQELGLSGEVFLADGEGYFVTPPKYPSTQGHKSPISARPMQSCLMSRQSGEVIDEDYRGVMTVMGFHFIPEFGSACIMSHITQEEAFASLKLLRQKIIIGLFLFCAILVSIAVYFANRIVRPIIGLTRVARSIAAGDSKAHAEVAGNDEVTELSASFNFMTDRLQAAQRHEAEALKELRVMFDTSGEGFWKVDQSGRIIEANDAYCRIVGYARDEIVGAHVSKFEAIEQTPEAIAAHMRRVVERGYDRFETRHRHHDGHLVDIEVTASFVQEAGCVIAFMHDVTKRKRIEEALRIAAATFETQEAIMVADPEANILRVNRAFEDLSGYSAEELIGQNPRLLQSGRHDKVFYRAMWSDLLSTGRWSGEIWDKRKNGEIYPKLMNITAVYNDHHQLTHYVAVSRDISQLKQSEQEIHQLAFYDPLTKLPNRRLLLDRLQQAMAVSTRSGRYGALLFLDLDRFKDINDTQGHAIGDLLLTEVARRLQNSVREGDSVGRLGGDEFVVVLEELSSEPDEAATQTELVAEKIRNELGQPYTLNNYECRTTPSIGISLFHGHLESTEDLFRHADTAMYQAKEAGRNTIRFFDPQMQEALEMRAALEADLRQALAKQQFRLYYQIQVDSLRRPLGTEALLRWEHPERGLVSPMQFIPLAEETGLILPVGLWVLQTACAQLKAWQHDALTRNLTLAVNVSAKQFHQADFVAQVQRALLESGAKPSLLKLELTESAVLESIQDTIARMHELKMLGVSFSMDDFGTGYSSLQYLKRLPLDQLKIDRSFVLDITSDPNDAAIVQTIIAMTQALGLNVIAEGVETEAQRDFLGKHGCHTFQGYLFGKPVPIEQFESQLKL